MGHKGPAYKAYVHQDCKGSNPMLISQSTLRQQTNSLQDS